MKWTRVISFISVISIGISCIGCGNHYATNERSSAAASVENSVASAESSESLTEDKTNEMASTSGVKEEKPEGEIESTVFGAGYGSWQQAYIAYIKDLEEKYPENSVEKYSLIHLDNDNVPELFINSGYELGGEKVLCYYDDRLTEQILSRIGSTYILYTGLVYNNCGHMGYLPVYIYKLYKGDIYKLGEGLALANYNDKGEESPTFEWEGIPCNEDEYFYNIRRLYPDDMGVRPFDWYSKTEMLSILNTGHVTSYGHRFEVFIGDSTWEEARRACEKKGGYLATITSYEEIQTVTELVKSCGVTEYGLYVGYKDRYWINKDGSSSKETLDIDYSEYADPKYDVYNKEWANSRNRVGLLKYNNNENTVYVYNAPDDLLKQAPQYKGRVGFICEYDN